MTTQDYYDKGYESGLTGLDNYTGFTQIYGIKPDDNREAWSSFCDGGYKALRERSAEKRARYKVDEFLARLKALCDEYEASISSGCGCCGAGLTVKDYETSIHINREPPDTE